VQSAPCTWRRGAHVSWLSLKTKVDSLSVVWRQNHWDGFLRFGLKTGGDGFLWFDLKTSGDGFLVESQHQGDGEFSGLGLKIDSYGLVIWASKSLRWFLGFDLKIKKASICRLRHKTDRRMRWRGTHVEI
jgi:hypothetical protein